MASPSCFTRHTERDARGFWLLGDDVLGVLLMSNGRRQLMARCPECGHQTTAIPHRYRPKPLDQLPILQDNTGRYPRESHRCEVVTCTSLDSQYHHWAPHGTFSRLLDPSERPADTWTSYEADLWPGSYLCQRHHTEWHSRMVGYAWNRRRRKAS